MPGYMRKLQVLSPSVWRMARAAAGSLCRLRTLAMEGAMKLNNVDDNNQECFSLGREMPWRDLDPPQLEWDESEVSAIVDDIVVRPRFAE
jgi:hypothetical protein